jgi:Flp pilus assembly protein TadB
MASDQGTQPPGVNVLLAVAAVAVVAGFILLATGSTTVGGLLMLVGAVCSGLPLLAMRRSRKRASASAARERPGPGSAGGR